MGPASEPEPVIAATGSMYTAVVPDEAIREIAKRIHDADCWEHRDDSGWCQYERDVRGRLAKYLASAAEAGWVFVPGPVHTEWGTKGEYDETPSVWVDEAQARRVAHPGWPLVSRQVTDWRPAEPTQDGDRP